MGHPEERQDLVWCRRNMGPLIDALLSRSESSAVSFVQESELDVRSSGLKAALQAALAFLPISVTFPGRHTIRYVTRSSDVTAGRLLALPLSLPGLPEVTSLADLGEIRSQKEAAPHSFSRQDGLKSVIASLDSLFNVVPAAADLDPAVYPEIARSVLGYGFPLLASEKASDASDEEIVEAVTSAITSFETRIESASLRVQVDEAQPRDRHGHVRLVIQGRLSGDQGQDALRVLTEFDFSTTRSRSSLA